MGDWKLLEFFEDERLELYNLREDIGEKHDLASRYPDKTRELHERLVAWRQSIGAAMPRPRTAEDGEAPPKPKKGQQKRRARQAVKQE